MQVFKIARPVCFLGTVWGVTKKKKKSQKTPLKIITVRLLFMQASYTFQGLHLSGQDFLCVLRLKKQI